MCNLPIGVDIEYQNDPMAIDITTPASVRKNIVSIDDYLRLFI